MPITIQMPRPILSEFQVNKVIRTGNPRPLTTASGNQSLWARWVNAVQNEPNVEDWNLSENPLRPGHEIDLGDAKLILVAGWRSWIPPDDIDTSESRNVISIVIRLVYKGKSVLFTGDTVGQHSTDKDKDKVCDNAEEFMVANSAAIPIRSNVVIAPHHGANNGSSGCFIRAAFFGTPPNLVSPRFVVFPSGHVNSYGHPRKKVVNRYKTIGQIGDNFIFRTDRGDDEKNGKHYDDPNGIDNCEDMLGDDDVDIAISSSGTLSVRYKNATDGPCKQ